MAKKKNLPLGNEKQRLTLDIPNEDAGEERVEPNLFSDAPSDEIEEESSLAIDEAPEPQLDENLFSVGFRLQQERERQGHSLDEMAEMLRLRPRQIQALEEGDYSDLPGQTFVIGFLRSYATALGLNASEIVELYRTEHAGQLDAPQLAFPEPTSEGRKPSSGLLIATCLIAVLAFGGWYYYQAGEKTELELVPDLPNRLIAKLESALGDKGDENASDLPDMQTENPASSLQLPENPQEQTSTANLPTAEPETPLEAPLASVETPAEPEVILTDRPSEQGAETKKVVLPDQSVADPESVAEDISAPVSVEPSNEPVVIPETAKVPVVANEVPDARELEGAMSPVPEQDTSSADQQITVVTESNAEKTIQSTEEYPQASLVVPPTAPVLSSEEIIPENLGVENTDARIVIVAHQEAWVQILGPGNETVLDRILEAGDTFMVPAQPDLKLSTANAGGLEIRLDGEVLGSLGGFGAIIRELDLNPTLLKDKYPAAQ